MNKKFLNIGGIVIGLAIVGALGYLFIQMSHLKKMVAEPHEQQSCIVPLHHTPDQLPLESRSWSALQAKMKNSVVQIFSQHAVVDLLQPYKTPNQGQSTGSGFFINTQGEIITNAHVVDQARAVWIQIPVLGKQQIDVDVIGVSPDRDLALLQVRPEGLKLIQDALGDMSYLNLGDSDLVQRADEIMTLGYPLGQQGLKSTTGVVSGREQHLIQIDAPINPGNSGGPSINCYGEVIGVNTLYAPDAQNVGYIIPINELKIILEDLRVVKLLRKPFLGIIFNNGSDALTQYLGNPLPGGLYVVDAYKDSPLHKAGVQKRDMVYEINGHRLDMYGEIAVNDEKISIVDYVAQLKLGQPISLVVYRQGKRLDFNFTFDQSELLPIRKIYPGYEKVGYEIIAGMVVQSLTVNHLPLLMNIAPGLTKYAEMKYQMEPVLIVTHIFPDSLAQRSRSLLIGTTLSEVNGQKVKTLDDLRTALYKSFNNDVITIETTDSVFVVIPFKKMLEQEQRLSKEYFYPLSPFVHDLITKMNAREQGAHEKK